MAAEGSSGVYLEEDHYQNCGRQVEELWRSRALCDIHLIVEDVEGKPRVSVPAHRVILAAAIPYFKAMLTSDMQESVKKEIVIKNVDETGLKRVVEYAYTGKAEITEENAQGLLTTANMLGLSQIVRACAAFISKHVSPVNCLGIRDFAQLHDLRGLLGVASQYAIENFAAVTKEDEFLGLEVEEVTKFVESDQINIDSEEDVYEAVTRWIQSDPKERNQHADLLYTHVRFPILPIDFLKNVVMKNELVSSSVTGKIMIQEALDYHSNPASIILFSNPKKIQPRSSVMGVICVVGGAGDSGQSLNDVTFFSPHEKEWKPGTKMRQHRSRLAVGLFRGELYAIGGCDITESLASVEKYSPIMNSWKSVASMNVARRSCSAVVTHRAIVVIGGYTGSVFLRSVEMYDPDLNEWTFQPAMLEARSELAAVFFDQRIYAIGGFNSHTQLKSVERFDLINRKWERVADMYASRANAAAGLLGQEIFVAGGQADKEVIDMAEVYNPELNQWECFVARMTTPRVGLAMVSMGNMIYVIGGSNGSEYLDSVECYDPSKATWVPVTKLPFPRFRAAAVVFAKSEHIASL